MGYVNRIIWVQTESNFIDTMSHCPDPLVPTQTVSCIVVIVRVLYQWYNCNLPKLLYQRANKFVLFMYLSWECCGTCNMCRPDMSGNRLGLLAQLPTAWWTNRTLGKTVFFSDVTFLRLQCWNSQAVDQLVNTPQNVVSHTDRSSVWWTKGSWWRLRRGLRTEQPWLALSPTLRKGRLWA